MEENENLKELEIILGLKEYSKELNIINKEINRLSFIGAISNILYSININDTNDSKEENNEMLDNFLKKTENLEIGNVKLELYKDSNFIEYIKEDNINKDKPELNYTEKYLSKLQNDFINEKEQQNVKNNKNNTNNYNNYNNKDNNYNNKNKKRMKNKEKLDKQENSESKDKEEIEPQNNELHEEDKKEIPAKDINEKIDMENEEFEEKEEKTDDKVNKGNVQSNNKRNYNRKYNKNKGHKEFRKNLNSKKYKNYK